MKQWFFYHWASPEVFYNLARRWQIPFAVIGMSLFLYGLISGLFLVPVDYQQGDAFRIIYIHVPCAFLSLLIYTVIFFSSCVYFIWHIKVADIIASVSAPIGATFTALTLVSGAIWGKPMWGTWWVWDARLTSELILLFIYLGYIGLRVSLPRLDIQARAAAILAIVGFIDIPIIHFSVKWWHTLHQGATLSQFKIPSIAPVMLWPLLVMIIAFIFGYITLMLFNTNTEILMREKNSNWVKRKFNI